MAVDVIAIAEAPAVDVVTLDTSFALARYNLPTPPAHVPEVQADVRPVDRLLIRFQF